MHLDDQQVRLLLDGELEEAPALAARAHAAECPACGERLAAAAHIDEEIAALLTQLDAPPPAVDAGEVVAQAGRHRRGLPRGPRTAVRWAAGALLALGLAAAAYAMPGSPLAAWLKALATGPGGAEPPAAAVAEATASGIAVHPGEGLLVRFVSLPAGSRARVVLVDDALLTVRAMNGEAAYSSLTARIDVEAAGTTLFEIEIPRAAPLVEVRAGERRVLLKEGARIAGPAGPWRGEAFVLPLSAP